MHKEELIRAVLFTKIEINLESQDIWVLVVYFATVTRRGMVLCADNLLLYDAQRGKKALIPHANSEGPHERAHPCFLIWTLSLRRYILQYLLFL